VVTEEEGEQEEETELISKCTDSTAPTRTNLGTTRERGKSTESTAALLVFLFPFFLSFLSFSSFPLLINKSFYLLFFLPTCFFFPFS
jgi:hypothetical protein